jgi:hypothetical protein
MIRHQTELDRWISKQGHRPEYRNARWMTVERRNPPGHLGGVFQFHTDDLREGLYTLSGYGRVHLDAGCLRRLVAELFRCKWSDLLCGRGDGASHHHPLQRNQKNPDQAVLLFFARTALGNACLSRGTADTNSFAPAFARILRNRFCPKPRPTSPIDLDQ